MFRLVLVSFLLLGCSKEVKPHPYIAILKPIPPMDFIIPNTGDCKKLARTCLKWKKKALFYESEIKRLGLDSNSTN